MAEHKAGFADAFPSVFDESFRPPMPRTLKELAMIKLSASIRAKPEWWIKYKDAGIRARWKAEALEQKFRWIEAATMLVPYEDREQYAAEHQRAVVDVTLSEKQVEYVLDELDGYAKLRNDNIGIQVSCFDGVWQSDALIAPALRSSLMEQVGILEDVPEDKKDWHPNSGNQVLDLVHPSLYPVVYGRTLGRYPDPKGVMAPIASPFSEENHTYANQYRSEKFQWLPTDFQVDDNGSVKALGYINNLHPTYEGLYRCIEDVIKCFVPLWEQVLTDMMHNLPTRIQGSYLPIEESDPSYPREEDVDEEEEAYSDCIDAYMENVWRNNKIVGLPDVPDGGYPGDLEKRDVDISLRGKKLQIIVKLANIHLSPDKPEYNGGSWHIEGMANERICASGIYYYDQENITSSELAFRIAVDEPEPAKGMQATEYDYHAHEVTWGMVMDYNDSTKLNNVVGAVETGEGRCIAFPNTYQHRVSPFKLVDPSKPGHRKILALFLVDPSVPLIPSTTHVSPQQATWATQALETTDPRAPVRQLPVEIINMIENDSVLMGEREAKALRLELMKERTVIMKNLDDPFDGFLFSRIFNLCEH